MLDAFKELGFDVTEVIGFSAERKCAIKKLERTISLAGEYLFAYGESSNAPFALNDPNRLPFHPFIDYKFFHLLKKNNIPFGYFYRDVYWKFAVFTEMLPWHLRALSLPFYQLDWIFLKKYVDHLFLPSKRMNEVLPSAWPLALCSGLPPGGDRYIDGCRRKLPNGISKVNCLYVGGVSPPLYDLRETVKEVSNLPFVDFVICCHESEWGKWRHIYEVNMGRNIQVVHKTSSELAELYSKANAFLMVRAPHEYMNYTIPIKLMECISYGVPIVCNSGSESARYIEKNQIGWVIDRPAELSALLSKLKIDSQEFDSKVNKIIELQQQNLWVDRAQQVAKTLTGYKENWAGH